MKVFLFNLNSLNAQLIFILLKPNPKTFLGELEANNLY